MVTQNIKLHMCEEKQVYSENISKFTTAIDLKICIKKVQITDITLYMHTWFWDTI